LDSRDYAREFVPYGTPCSELFDPATQKLEILQCQLEVLKGQLAELQAEAAAPDAAMEPAPRTSKGGRKRA
jgi:serine O-acetyltransferase